MSGSELIVLYHVPLSLQCIYECTDEELKMTMGRKGESTDYLTSYADDLVLCDELEEDLRAMVGCFIF